MPERGISSGRQPSVEVWREWPSLAGSECGQVSQPPGSSREQEGSITLVSLLKRKQQYLQNGPETGVLLTKDGSVQGKCLHTSRY